LARKIVDEVDERPISLPEWSVKKTDIISVTQKKSAFGKIELTINPLFDKKVILAF